MMMKDYRCKVGVAFFGGCGSNVLRLILDQYTPEQYPDFLLFGANTDAKVHRLHFGDEENEAQKRWKDVGAFTIHQLGGHEVTGGRGAGGKPEVGRKAAETEESMEAMRRFFESVDEVLLVGAVGGGTGTGALPVAAKLSKVLGKPTLALVVTPGPEEGRNKRATDALTEIQSIVPTIPIRNAYLQEYIAEKKEKAKAELTFKDAWQIVNNHSVVPMLLIIREMLQVTGDVVNLDQADWDTMLSHGNHVFFGLAKVDPKKLHATSAQEIANELFIARFQDPGVPENGEIVGLWAHGPWPMGKTNEVTALIRGRISANRISQREIEIHRGIVDNVDDNLMWIAIIIVAKEVSAGTTLPPDQEKQVLVASAMVPNGISQQSRVPLAEKPTSTSVRFLSRGKWVEKRMSPDLAARFHALRRNIKATREEHAEVFSEVESATGDMPDLPERFIERLAERKPGFIESALGGIFPKHSPGSTHH